MMKHMAHEYIATNPRTKNTFKGTAADKNAFLIMLVAKAPHIAGWYPDEVRECVEQDLIREASV